MRSHRPLALALLSAALAAPVRAPAAALPQPMPQEAAAVVNGVVVPRKALLDVVQSLIAQLDDVPDTQTTEKYRRQALDSLIDFELLYQEGQSRKLAVSEAEVAEAIKRTEKSFPTPQAYQDALRSKGLTRQDIENETRRALLVDRVLRDVVWPGVGAPESAVQAYYDAHRAEFTHPAQTRASYILIRTKKGAKPAERSQAKARAEGLAQQARDGDDFARLASEASEDPATAQIGGDLGYIEPGTMGAAFDQAAAGLQIGQVSDVVETPFGFVIIKVTGKRDAGTSPIGEVRERIVVAVKEEGRAEAQKKFLQELRAKASIEIAPDLR